MAKKTIAVDLDDVLAQHATAFVSFSNAYYGTNLNPEDYDDYWMNLWGELPDEEIERRAAEFHIPETTLAYAKIEEAEPVLTRLRQDYDLVIVTARPKQIIPATYEWLNLHYEGVFGDVHFVPIWEPDNKTTKADICNEIGAEFLIDDVVKHCNIAAEGGITALLFGDYGWGKKETDPRVTRVKDWQAVQEYFDGRG